MGTQAPVDVSASWFLARVSGNITEEQHKDSKSQNTRKTAVEQSLLEGCINKTGNMAVSIDILTQKEGISQDPTPRQITASNYLLTARRWKISISQG